MPNVKIEDRGHARLPLSYEEFSRGTSGLSG